MFDLTDTTPDLCEQCCSTIEPRQPIWVRLLLLADGSAAVQFVHEACRPAFDAARAAA